MKVELETKQRAAELVESKCLEVAPLATRVGVSQSTLWNFLYGKTYNFSKLRELARELKVSLAYLMTGQESGISLESAVPYVLGLLHAKHPITPIDIASIDSLVSDYLADFVKTSGELPPQDKLDAFYDGIIAGRKKES